MTATTLATAPAGKALRVALWVAQVLLAIAFTLIGWTKLTTPIADLAAMMKWPGEYPAAFVRTMGCIDMLGGIGILLPALTRILPGLSTLAAWGCTVLQLLAIGFHLSRGEASVLPLNVVLLALSLFILWGRTRRAPITSRS